MTVKASVAASGEYTLAVTFSNEAGRGATAYASAWLGYDVPLDVTNVKLAENDGKLSLTWNAVTKGSQGAFFDPEAVTYSVVRYPGGIEVANGLKTTVLEEAIPEVGEFTRISYGVTAHLGDNESGESRSNNYLAGYLEAPFSEDFSSADCMDYITMVNANGDTKTWQLYKMGEHRSLVIDYNYSSDMDDWAVLHPMRLEAGKRYEIGCDAKGTSSYYTETFEVVVATDSDIESLRGGTSIVPRTDTNAENYSTYTSVFVPSETGVYYVAVRCISADKYAFLVDDFTMITADDVVTDLELIGYHVYCDNKRITDSPLTETSYIHTGLSNGIHVYNVSCLYNYGESAPSNTVEIDFGMTGVDGVGTGSARIVASNGKITVYGAEGVEVCVCDALGRVLHSGVASSSVTVVEVPAGVYVVRVGTSSAKVMLR